MHIHTRFRGHLNDLIARHPQYALLENISMVESKNRRWFRNAGQSYSFDLQVIIIGKTGYGKSTTLNVLLGKEIVETMQSEACTRDVQSFEFMINQNTYLSIADFPGIGESTARDVEYLEVYKRMEPRADAIVYVLRADTRDYSVDSTVMTSLFSMSDTIGKVILAVNFCDKIEPTSRCTTTTLPSEAQLANISLKVAEIRKIFQPIEKVVPYSAETKWNLDALHECIVMTTLQSEYIYKDHISDSGIL